MQSYDSSNANPDSRWQIHFIAPDVKSDYWIYECHSDFRFCFSSHSEMIVFPFIRSAYLSRSSLPPSLSLPTNLPFVPDEFWARSLCRGVLLRGSLRWGVHETMAGIFRDGVTWATRTRGVIVIGSNGDLFLIKLLWRPSPAGAGCWNEKGVNRLISVLGSVVKCPVSNFQFLPRGRYLHYRSIYFSSSRDAVAGTCTGPPPRHWQSATIASRVSE